MTKEEKLVGVCEDCKHLLMYDWELDGEVYYICALSYEEVRLNHTCEEYEKRPLFYPKQVKMRNNQC